MTVALLVAGFALGLPVGRRLPRRGRHARPRAPWARRRWQDLAEARRAHPTARDEHVVIDLRAWLPDEAVDAIDAVALRAALLGRRPSAT